MDQETLKIAAEQRKLKDYVMSEGWAIVRAKFVDKIMELQSVADFSTELDTCDPTKLLHEMKANKKSSEILFALIREIEGEAMAADETTSTVDNSYIVKV